LDRRHGHGVYFYSNGDLEIFHSRREGQ